MKYPIGPEDEVCFINLGKLLNVSNSICNEIKQTTNKKNKNHLVCNRFFFIGFFIIANTLCRNLLSLENSNKRIKECINYAKDLNLSSKINAKNFALGDYNSPQKLILG